MAQIGFRAAIRLRYMFEATRKANPNAEADALLAAMKELGAL